MAQAERGETWSQRVEDLRSSDPVRQAAAYAHLRRLIIRCLGRTRLASLGDDADDFVQDRITDLVTGRVEIRTFDTFEPFVGRICRTRFIDRMRQSGRRREWLREYLDTSRVLGRDRVEATETDPSLLERLQQAVRSLDAESAAILELRRVKGWTLERTARQLGMSISTLHARERKCLAQLYEALKELL